MVPGAGGTSVVPPSSTWLRLRDAGSLASQVDAFGTVEVFEVGDGPVCEVAALLIPGERLDRRRTGAASAKNERGTTPGKSGGVSKVVGIANLPG